jgi:hypothetical protein
MRPNMASKVRDPKPVRRHRLELPIDMIFWKSITPQLSERGAPPRDPAPSAPLGHGLQGKTCSSSCSERLHPILKLEPMAYPGRFVARTPIGLKSFGDG